MRIVVSIPALDIIPLARTHKGSQWISLGSPELGRRPRAIQRVMRSEMFSRTDARCRG